jgi:hypothetical protein
MPTNISVSISTASEILIAGIVSGGAGVIGAVSGICAERWLRRKGAVQVFISDWRLQFRGRGENGIPVDVPAAQAEFVQLFFTGTFYNTREEPVGLRALAVEFLANGQTLAIIPGDADSLKVEPTREVISDLEVVNLQPKHCSLWHFRRNIWGTDVAKVAAAERVSLGATDPTGKRLHYPIAELAGAKYAF